MAKRIDIVAFQNESFSSSIELIDEYGIPMDLSDYTAMGGMKRHYGSANTVSFDCDLNPGEVKFTIPTDVDIGRYVYDIDLVHNSTQARTKLNFGIAFIQGSVI